MAARSRAALALAWLALLLMRAIFLPFLLLGWWLSRPPRRERAREAERLK